jgi:D-methionine transport system ATP-binding protein
MIELVDINKHFKAHGREIIALDQINLHVKKGVIFGVIGQSGAGKSTLLRLVNLLERPSSGRVLVDGQDLTSMSDALLRKTRRQIGMIFQHFNLLGSANVFDNIALPLKFMGLKKKAIDEAITPLIELTGLVSKEKHFPHQLSGGQKQRVAIARALATKPSILLSDEATSALDPKTTETILDLLRKINETTGLTILLITHELDVIKAICHQVALIDKGRIIESNTVEDFFAKPKSDLANQIVKSSLKMHLPPDLAHDLSPVKTGHKIFPLVRIIFRGTLIREAIISKASRQFMLDISILQSNIEFIGKSTIGSLLAELKGDCVAIDQCLHFFTQQNLEYSVVGYVS